MEEGSCDIVCLVAPDPVNRSLRQEEQPGKAVCLGRVCAALRAFVCTPKARLFSLGRAPGAAPGLVFRVRERLASESEHRTNVGLWLLRGLSPWILETHGGWVCILK